MERVGCMDSQELLEDGAYMVELHSTLAPYKCDQINIKLSCAGLKQYLFPGLDTEACEILASIVHCTAKCRTR